MTLYQLLRIDRPLFVFDLETTELNPKNARIVEIAFQQYATAGLQREWRSLVSPGVPISKEASEKHGITHEIVTGCRECGKDSTEHVGVGLSVGHEFKPWPTFKQLAASFKEGFANCDYAGKNIRFDLRVLAAEMDRAGVPWSYAAARVIDADRLEQLGEPRTLAHLYKKHTGDELEDAHHALADVRATTIVLERQLAKYHLLPRDIDQLHHLQWPGWIDTDGKFKFVDGEPIITFGKWANRRMKDVPKDYWDWMVGPKSDFSAEIKAIASKAKLGEYPHDAQ